MEFHVETSQFSINSQLKEAKCDDRDYSLNWDFAVIMIGLSQH